MNRLSRHALCAFLPIAITGASAAMAEPDAAARVPLIVELFTSQSCSSCPPAEELAARLVREQPLANVEIIVLAEHVDYWDDLGWKDPYSSPDWTHRQTVYSERLSSPGRVYTPQAVIDGRKGVVGSNRGEVVAALQEAAKRPHSRLPIRVQRDHDAAVVTVGSFAALPPGHVIWAALLQDGIATRVQSGENGGSTLDENGVMRTLTRMDSRSARLPLPADALAAPYRVVVFAQNAGDRQMLAAAQASVPTP